MNKSFSDADRFQNLGSLSSMDDFDLASLGLVLPGKDEPDEPEEPTINPLHDMDSLDFHLWMEEEVDKELMRRMAQNRAKQTEKK